MKSLRDSLARAQAPRSTSRTRARRTVCLLTELEVKGTKEINCANHRHVRREVADQMLREGELRYLDRWKTQALDIAPVKHVTPATITKTEMEHNALSRIEPHLPAVRAARRKVKIWPYIGDEKAVRVWIRS